MPAVVCQSVIRFAVSRFGAHSALDEVAVSLRPSMITVLCARVVLNHVTSAGSS